MRAGSILPLGPEIQYVDEKPADPIELRIYPGANGTFSLYEDSGNGYDYEHGAYSRITFTWNDDGRQLTIGQRQGGCDNMIAMRTFLPVTPAQGIDQDAPPSNPITYNGTPISLKSGS